MTTTTIILLLNAFVQLTASLLRLYSTARNALVLALWRKRLLRSLLRRRE